MLKIHELTPLSEMSISYVFMFFLLFPYPLLSHDRGDQFVIGDIERGVIDFYAVCGHAFLVPHIGDFGGGALFDVDVGAGGRVHVNGGRGGADVEGDAVVSGEDGDT